MIIHLGSTTAVKRIGYLAAPDEAGLSELLDLAVARGVAIEAPWNEDAEVVRQLVNDAKQRVPADIGPCVMDVAVSPDSDLVQAIDEIKRCWSEAHDDVPTWIDGDDSALVSLLAREWGCSVGAPIDVEETHYTLSGPPGIGDRSWLQYNEAQDEN